MKMPHSCNNFNADLAGGSLPSAYNPEEMGGSTKRHGSVDDHYDELCQDYNEAIGCLRHCEQVIKSLQEEVASKNETIGHLEDKLVEMSLELASSKAFIDEHKSKRRSRGPRSSTDGNDRSPTEENVHEVEKTASSVAIDQMRETYAAQKNSSRWGSRSWTCSKRGSSRELTTIEKLFNKNYSFHEGDAESSERGYQKKELPVLGNIIEGDLNDTKKETRRGSISLSGVGSRVLFPVDSADCLSASSETKCLSKSNEEWPEF